MMIYELLLRTGTIIIHGLREDWLQGEACFFVYVLLYLKIDTAKERNFGSKNKSITENFLMARQYFRI